jgi:hypothetical protein
LVCHQRDCGLVAQAKRTIECLGAKWIARTPPKRQGEGSNPSEPVKIMVLSSGFYYEKSEQRELDSQKEIMSDD